MQIAGENSPPPDSLSTLSIMENRLLAGDVSRQTHESIVAQIEGAGKNTTSAGEKEAQRKPTESARAPDAVTIAGLLLGSPEFQRR